MSAYSDVQTYGLSREQAWRMLPERARRELELRHDGRIPLASMIDAMSWPMPAPRSELDEELHWIAVYGASARRSARHHLRLIRQEPQYRDIYLACLRNLRAEHSLLMARRGHLRRLRARAAELEPGRPSHGHRSAA